MNRNETWGQMGTSFHTFAQNSMREREIQIDTERERDTDKQRDRDREIPSLF